MSIKLKINSLHIVTIYRYVLRRNVNFGGFFGGGDMPSEGGNRVSYASPYL